MKIKNTDFLFAENPNPMWIFDPTDLSIHQVNDAACDLYGYTEKEFLALTIADLRPEEEIPKLMEEVAKDIDTFSNAGIWKHRKKNGELLFVRILSYPIFREDKKFELISAQDVTNKIQYREELHMLLENSLDGIMLTSPDGRIHKANKAACQILGMSEEQIIDLGRDGLVYNDEKLQKALNNRSQTGEFSGELTFIHSSGRKFPVELTTSVYENPEGQLRTSMIFRDITQQKNTQQKLQETLERYHYATKATSDAIYDWDIVNDQHHLGDGFNEIFGHDAVKESFPLVEYTKFVHPDDHPEALKSLKKTLKDPSLDHWSHEYRLKKSDGGYAHVVENAYIIRNADGEAVRMVGAIRDITKQWRLERLLDQAYTVGRIGVWELSLESNELYWSAITKELHEVEPNFKPELETAINFYKEVKSRTIIQKAINEAIEDGIPWDVEHQIVTAKGNERWVRSKGEPEMVDGRCRRIYGIFQDIHERKEAQKRIIEALQERQRILERISEAFFAVDEDWTVTYWNNQAEKVLGLSRQEVLGNNLWEVFPEAKELDFFHQYKSALEQQITVSFEEYYPPVNTWFEVHGYPSRDGLSVFFRDITERKKADQTLHELYRRNRLILESTGEGIYGIDTEGLCTFINEAAADMLGYKPEQCIGKNMQNLIHHKFADRSTYPESECPIFVSKNRHEGCRVMDELFWKADGTSIEVEYTSNPMIEDGEIKGAVVVFSDITERKQKEAQLQESLKEKETLLAEIHHRVKNNLAVVSGMIQLQAFQEEDESLKHKLNNSVSRIKTIANIHELLYQSNSFSRLNLDENIKKLVAEIAQTFHPVITPKINFDLQKIDLNINQAIPASLIVNEVVTNVFKHAFDEKDQKKLWITMAEKNNTVSIQIADNGKGLPANFNEIENASSLGLQLIDTLAQQLDGDYKYESDDGKTHFKLTFKKKEAKGSGSANL